MSKRHPKTSVSLVEGNWKGGWWIIDRFDRSDRTIEEGATGENTGRIANYGFRVAVRANSVESGLPGSVDRCPGRAAIYNHPCSLPPSLAPALSLGLSPSLLRLSALRLQQTAPPPTWLPCEQLHSPLRIYLLSFFFPRHLILRLLREIDQNGIDPILLAWNVYACIRKFLFFFFFFSFFQFLRDVQY